MRKSITFFCVIGILFLVGIVIMASCHFLKSEEIIWRQRYVACDTCIRNMNQLLMKDLESPMTFSQSIPRTMTSVQRDSMMIRHTDSVMGILRNNQMVLIQRQADLINDIRQETNNIIDKFNAWLAFWLAVMALLGVVVPIALQYRLGINQKEELEREENRLRDCTVKIEREGDSNKIFVQSAVKDIKEEIRNIQSLREQWKKQWENKLEKNTIILRLQTDVSTLMIWWKNRLQEASLNYIPFIQYILTQSLDLAERIIRKGSIAKPNERETHRIQIIQTLLILDNMVVEFLMAPGDNHLKTRQLESVGDRIRVLIGELANSNYRDWQDVCTRSLNVIGDFRRIHF